LQLLAEQIGNINSVFDSLATMLSCYCIAEDSFVFRQNLTEELGVTLTACQSIVEYLEDELLLPRSKPKRGSVTIHTLNFTH
jgi:hypothetical protein